MNDPITHLNDALAGRYSVDREIGQGGMATVYLADDLKHGRTVALKVLKPELAAIVGAQRFLAEIKTTANLQHPHILPLFDSGEADGFLYYVMPYVEGESLRARLDLEHQLPVEDAVRIATDLAEALDYAHRHGVVHRDIKPANVLLHDGQPVIADFGIALAVGSAGGHRLTETGLSLGTPHYMSPEQATGDQAVGPTTDIYALGCVLYEMLVGEPPYTGSTPQAILGKIIAGEPASATAERKSVPANVDAAIAKALEKLPADRFTQASGFAAALKDSGFRLLGASVKPSEGSSLLWKRVSLSLTVLTVILGAIALRGWMARGASNEAPVRFTLTLPEGQGAYISEWHDVPFAISPDGSTIVYKGPEGLYVRPMDRVDPTLIAGTEGGDSPFFSPDGLWIGFLTGGGGVPGSSVDTRYKVLKVPRSGGIPTVLAGDVQSGHHSASWGDDGYIVYSSDGSRLSRVHQDGGEVEAMLSLEEFEAGMFWPFVLPGGRDVLFVQCSGACRQYDVAVLDRSTSEVRVLVEGATRAWYAPTGHLLYSRRDGRIYAARFDLGRMEVTGPEVPVLEEVALAVRGSGRLTISAAGTIAYQKGPIGLRHDLVAVSRDGVERPLSGQAKFYRSPRLSPNGQRLAVAIPDPIEFPLGVRRMHRVWILDLQSGISTPVSADGSFTHVAWSPEGDRIVVRAERDGQAELFWLPVDGSAPPAPLMEGRTTDGFPRPVWSADGKWIVTDEFRDENDRRVLLAIRTDGDRAVQALDLSSAEGWAPALSPNGEWLAYVSNEAGRNSVHVTPFPEAGRRYTVAPEGQAPQWVSDNEIAYANPATGMLEVAELQLTATVRAAGQQPLFSLATYRATGLGDYDVTRDGREFLLQRPRPNFGASDPEVVLNWFEELGRLMVGSAAGEGG